MELTFEFDRLIAEDLNVVRNLNCDLRSRQPWVASSSFRVIATVYPTGEIGIEHQDDDGVPYVAVLGRVRDSFFSGGCNIRLGSMSGE
ncbi:TPA_asm: hypothetical protein [ssRNA phage SRR5467091_1]|uniref:Uncharacterized protein n=1 Tax=ssRNA phage SRR5467091_1 TaxID=2786459 RepID=A0A8S5L0E0_9VIRU|nr:hypothetical protein QII93_gp3 [ssRNA phage SRR5467091_1]DAD50908.1 TPA_asm: hypothetical protein [ssRNA phage SRR5467091_1]